MPSTALEETDEPRPDYWTRDDTAPNAPSALDIQEGGDHYQNMGLHQPWIVAKTWMTPEEMKGAMKLTVMSYLAREADKGGRQDIKKALHTIQIYLELTEDAQA